jgi:alkylhydroperoxidase family enzyme
MGLSAAAANPEWGECIVPAAPVPSALQAEVRKAVGAVPGWLPRLAPSPWIVRALSEIIARPFAHAPVKVCFQVALVVSQENSCRYCYGIQRAVLKIFGQRDEHIDALVRETEVSELTPALRAALDLARRLTRSNPRPGGGDFEALVRAGFSRPAAAEIVFVAAANAFTNRVGTLLVLPPEPLESFVASPVFRFVRPLLAWRMHPRLRPPEPAPRPNDGPCAAVVAALDGSPAAGVLRRAIDGAWASAVLPRRTKTLMLAVIARALGCAHGEEEARRFLAAEGVVSAELDDILANLGSPRLDAREARLVPFARETVRYQPAAIQRRMRELARGLTTEELLEAVGIAALANAVCRMSVVIDAC